MGMNSPKNGAPGTTDQSPRWEGDRDAKGDSNSDPEVKKVSDAFKTKDG